MILVYDYGSPLCNHQISLFRSVRCSHILLCINGDGSEGFTAKLSGLRYACSLHDPPGQGLQDRYDYPLHVAKTNLNWLSPEFLQQASANLQTNNK